MINFTINQNTLNDMRLAYSDQGSGLAIVLIHGFCENKELWTDLQEKLSAGYRVLTVDLPGHGQSAEVLHELTIEIMAQMVNELLEELAVQKCVMIGHSLGGYVALAFAEIYSEKLCGFGLFHSTAFADTEDKKRNRDRTVEFIEKHGMDAFADSFVAPLFYPKNREQLSAEIDQLKDTCRKMEVKTVVATTLAMRDRKDRIEVLKQTNLPVLFIIGREDNAVPYEKSMEQCYLPEKHHVHVLEETGHMGMYERKEESIKAFREFLQGID